MANRILKQLAISSQFKTTPFCTLQFSASQWQLFWRLLVVGCIMSDHLIEAAEQFAAVSSHAAKLWNELSSEVAEIVSNGEIVQHNEVGETKS